MIYGFGWPDGLLASAGSFSVVTEGRVVAIEIELNRRLRVIRKPQNACAASSQKPDTAEDNGAEGVK